MDNKILMKGAEKYNINLSELSLIGGYSNNVYEYQGKEGNFILKFYLPPFDISAIQSELDWILYLLKSEIKVANPLPSKNEKYIETIELRNGEKYYVVAFQKVMGTIIDTQNKEEWNQEFFYLWGDTLGKIHSIAKKYKPSNFSARRLEWNEGILFSDYADENIENKWKMYVNKLESLPKDNDSYGMIHGDLHINNFFVHQKEMVLFDFGDCEYNWFVYDIAIVLYHAIQSIDSQDDLTKTNFAHQFIKSFLKGYLAVNNLTVDWIKKLPFFINYRQIYSYRYFNTTLNNEQKNNGKVKEKLNIMRNRIENDIPYVQLDLENIL